MRRVSPRKLGRPRRRARARSRPGPHLPRHGLVRGPEELRLRAPGNRRPCRDRGNLRQGWNLVGCTSFTARPVVTAFAGIAYTRVEGFDANLPPYYLKALTPAQNLEIGKAYWVHVTADATWVVTF